MYKRQVLPRITNNLPTESFDMASLKISKGIFLADPQFNNSSQIDILLGAQYFLQLIEPTKFVRSPHFPIIQETKLGFILAGNLPFNVDMTKPVSSFIARDDNNAISSQLKTFWQLEDVSCRTPSAQDTECEDHFLANTYRNDSGRFVVSLPRSTECLGDSLPGAVRRFQTLELKFRQNQSLHKEYTSFMQEYLNLGHMSPLDSYDLSINKSNIFYLPHHAVVKSTSTTTKLRVVFDGSAKTSNNLSLNDTLMVGPTVQQLSLIHI